MEFPVYSKRNSFFYWFFFKFGGNLTSRWCLHSPPSGRRMLNTIDYQIIISLIKFTTKFEEEPVFIDLTLMPSLIVYIPLFIRVAAMRVTTRSSLRVNSYLQTVFSGEFPIHLLLKAYGIKTWSNKEAERFTFISLFVNLR